MKSDNALIYKLLPLRHKLVDNVLFLLRENLGLDPGLGKKITTLENAWKTPGILLIISQ